VRAINANVPFPSCIMSGMMRRPVENSLSRCVCSRTRASRLQLIGSELTGGKIRIHTGRVAAPVSPRAAGQGRNASSALARVARLLVEPRAVDRETGLDEQGTARGYGVVTPDAAQSPTKRLRRRPVIPSCRTTADSVSGKQCRARPYGQQSRNSPAPAAARRRWTRRCRRSSPSAATPGASPDPM
jgi:hypothetical protein